jgi:hypothetical protein
MMRRLAIKTVQQNLDYLESWFEKTYQRPSCDPLFLGQTSGYWQQRMLIDLARRKKGLEADLEAASQWQANATTTATMQSLQERINIIGRVFGEDDVQKDEQIDEWDAALMRDF